MQKVPDPRSGGEVTVYRFQGLDLESVMVHTVKSLFSAPALISTHVGRPAQKGGRR